MLVPHVIACVQLCVLALQDANAHLTGNGSDIDGSEPHSGPDDDAELDDEEDEELDDEYMRSLAKEASRIKASPQALVHTAYSGSGCNPPSITGESGSGVSRVESYRTSAPNHHTTPRKYNFTCFAYLRRHCILLYVTANLWSKYSVALLRSSRRPKQLEVWLLA